LIVYVNGDSYAYMSDGKRYSEYLGDLLQCPSINAAISGSCNERIFRTALRDLIRLKKEHADIVAVISLSFTVRTEIWHRNPERQDKWKQSGDGDFISIKPTIQKNWIEKIKDSTAELLPIYKDYAVSWLTWYDVEAETTKLLQNILLFTTWCRSNNIRYVIISGPLQQSINFSAPFVETFYDKVKSDPQVLDIFNFSFTEWSNQQGFTPIDDHTQEIDGKTYIIGHQGEQAHQAFAQLLVDHIHPLSYNT